MQVDKSVCLVSM